MLYTGSGGVGANASFIYPNTTYAYDIAGDDLIIGYGGDAGATITTGDAAEDLTIDPNTTGDIIFEIGSTSSLQIIEEAAPAEDMVLISNSGGGTTTNGVDALSIDFTQGSGSGKTNSAINIAATSGGVASDNFYGLQIGNLSGAGASTNEYAITIGTGWDRGLSVATNSVIGSGSDTFTFNPSRSVSDAIYAGAARPAKTLTLSPEYEGATLTASGSSEITGTMTADASPSAAWRTWYEWTSSSTDIQNYTVVVRATLPSDFSAWSGTNPVMTVAYNTEDTSTNFNHLDITAFLSTDTTGVPVFQKLNNVSGTDKIWTTVSINSNDVDDGTGDDWDAAGETAVIYLKMYSKQTNYTQIGDIVLNYLSKF